MGYFKEVIKDCNRLKCTINIFLLLFFIIGSSYIGLQYYRSFQIVVEIFSSFIALAVFIIAINSYEISKNIPFLFLGFAYGLAGAFNIIHLVTSNGMGVFQGDTTNLSLIFSIIPRFITAVSILICCRLFYKSYKIITPFTIALGFSILSVAILMLVFFYDIFPICYVQGYGLTLFKILSECVVSVILLISIVVLFEAKNFIEPKAFLLYTTLLVFHHNIYYFT